MTAKFKKWMKLAGGDLRKAGASNAETSVVMLIHILKKRRVASADLAARIARGLNSAAEAAGRMDLPVLARGDISPVCRMCPYYYRCDNNLD